MAVAAGGSEPAGRSERWPLIDGKAARSGPIQHPLGRRLVEAEEGGRRGKAVGGTGGIMRGRVGAGGEAQGRQGAGGWPAAVKAKRLGTTIKVLIHTSTQYPYNTLADTIYRF